MTSRARNAFLTLSLLAASSASAQEDSQVRDMKEVVRSIRDLEVKQSVTHHIISGRELPSKWGSLLFGTSRWEEEIYRGPWVKRPTPEARTASVVEEIKRYEQAMKAFGLYPPGFDSYKQTLSAWESFAGFYLSDEQAFYVFEEFGAQGMERYWRRLCNKMEGLYDERVAQLGMVYHALDENRVKEYGLGASQGGLVVDEVNPGSISDGAGFEKADLILDVSGQALAPKDTVAQLRRILNATRGGVLIPFGVRRKGSPLTLRLKWLDLNDLVAINKGLMRGGPPYPLEVKFGFSGMDAILFHELVHAAQEDHWPLHEFFRSDSGDMDQALRALVEGDARAAEAKFCAGDRSEAFLTDFRQSYDELCLKDKQAYPPRYLQVGIEFRYADGSAFVNAVKKARGGKWSAVDECYSRPPLSTHEILHPEEYLSGAPTVYSIELPSLGQNRWVPVWNSSLGEFGIRFVLRSTNSGGSLRTVLNPVDADRIAEGIRGDRYQVFEENPGKPPMLVWVTLWQDPKSARAFFNTYAKILGWKYPSARVPKDGDAEDSYRLTGDGRTAFVSRQDKLIVIGENLPEEASEEIREKLSKSLIRPLSRPDPQSKGVYVFECSTHPDGTVSQFPVACRRCGASPTRKDKP